MTNNRKPVDEIRLSLSAAREDDSQPLHIATEGSLNQLPTKHRKGWTPAPTKPAYSQTNVSLEHKGRDYDAILRAAKRKPVGYYEDAPYGAKFGGSGKPTNVSQEATQRTPQAPAHDSSAPTTPPPSQSADGPWPKWYFKDMREGRETWLIRYDNAEHGTWYAPKAAYPGDDQCTGRSIGGLAWTLANCTNVRSATESEAAQWLEQNGHKGVAAQLRGKDTTPPRADVATGGGRVYLESKWWYRVRIGERVWFKRHPDNQTPIFEHGWHEQHYGGGMEPANADECIRARGGTELFGPERDAILAECRAAMGL